HDIARGARHDVLGWLVLAEVGLDVRRVGGDVDQIARPGVQVLLEALAEVDPAAAADHVRGGLRLALMVGPRPPARQTCDASHPDLPGARGVAVDTRATGHAWCLARLLTILTDVDDANFRARRDLNHGPHSVVRTATVPGSISPVILISFCSAPV